MVWSGRYVPGMFGFLMSRQVVRKASAVELAEVGITIDI